MSQENNENDPLSWENQPWANLCNDTSDNSGGDKELVVLDTGDNKGKKRVRGSIRKAKEKGENEEKKEGGEDHEIHVWTERERRKKMRNMFTNLHALLPQLPPKADKTSIVDEAIHYIKTLESTLQRLQKQKLDKFRVGLGGPSKSLAHEPTIGATSRLAMLSTREAFMADQVSTMVGKPNTTSLSTSASYHLPVVIQTWTSSNVVLNICGNEAQFTVYASKKLGMFTTLCCILEKHKLEVVTANIFSHADRSVYMIQARVANGGGDQFSGLMNVEEMYKQAAGEMMMWVSS
ncbi:transcription factor bHLH95-like [Silene latifolia]|uniref:transcription factor bHLH95-like n=1 Tax=Silene latifolia TaxID=37657 RepID=UPI003D78438F